MQIRLTSPTRQGCGRSPVHALLERLITVMMLPLLAFCLHAADAQTREDVRIPVLTHAQMLSDLDYLTFRLKRAWAYAEDKRAWLGVDIDSLRATAARELDSVRDADGFYFLVKKYIGGLMDGHAGVRPGHESPALMTPMHWPFFVTRLDGHFYIKSLEGDNTPLGLGDEVLRVNGLSLCERFEIALARSTGSTPAGREWRALDTMRYGADELLHVEGARVGGSNLTCELPALREAPVEQPIHWEKLAGNFGYLRLPSFRQDMKVWEAGGRTPAALQAGLAAKKTALRQAFAELKHTSALVLDLRGNPGGSDALGHFLAHYLCDTEAHPVYYTLLTRDSEDLRAITEFAYLTNMPVSAAQRRSPIQLLPEKGVERYGGKLTVLMDEGCFSACDCFLNYLSVAAPKTVFVGRPNGAGAGAPRPVVTLPQSKIVVTFCVMQVWNLDGQLIESRPLKPTVPVQWTRDDLLTGRDPDLAAALRWLQGQEL